MKMFNLKNMLVAGATVALMSGCQSTGSKTADSALIGAGAGAVAGQLIGGNTGATLGGAVIGGALGAAYGDSQEKK